MVKLLFQPNLWNIPSPSKIDKNDFDYSISDIGWLNHGVEDLLLQITDAYGLILEIFHSKDWGNFGRIGMFHSKFYLFELEDESTN